MRSPHLRICFDLCGAVSLLAWGALVEIPKLPHGPLGLTTFLAMMAVLWLGFLGAFLCARQTASITFQRILVWGIIFRIIAWMGSPIFEDDHFRHLWDGREFAEKGSPYQHTPAESFPEVSLPEKFQRILGQVNDPYLHSTAQPLSQFLFLGAYAISPGETWPLKLFLIVADLVAVIALMQLVSPRQSLLYLWSPLLLFETYFQLHLELMAIALLLLAVLHLSRRQHTPSIVASALTIGIHPFGLLPTLWIASKSKIPGWALALLTVGSLYSYFLYHDGWAMFSGVRSYLQPTEFNSFFYGLVSTHLPRFMTAGLCLLGFALCLGFWLRNFQKHSREIPRFDWLFIALFLFLPTVYPSSLLWILPWAIFRPSAWAFTAMAVVSLSYSYGNHLPPSDLAPYAHPDWARPAEFGTVALVALAEGMISSSLRKKAEVRSAYPSRGKWKN